MGFLLFLLFDNLQSLAADEVGPGADFGGDLTAAGQLLAHALCEELGSLEGDGLVR
jgi:hypothetical protein